MTRDTLIWLAGWACLAPVAVIAVHSLYRDLRPAWPVIIAAAQALFPPEPFDEGAL